MNEGVKNRIRELRGSLGLTQAAFGERLGLRGNTIATYEAGRIQPSAGVCNNICKEFSVNPAWLETGEGEMLLPAPEGSLDALALEYHLTSRETMLVSRFLETSPAKREAILEFIEGAAAELSRKSEIDAKVEEYRRQLEIEARTQESSRASPEPDSKLA